MKEIKDIIIAYHAARSQGKKTALATVVHVEGSSYRRPGARMLITEDGILTGAISGGCLEGDALRKALLAINENKTKLVTYDTTDEDDAKFGVQLGCNGIVHILFEPINEAFENNPLQLLIKVKSERRTAVLTTLFSLVDRELQLGTSFLLTATETVDQFPEQEHQLAFKSLKKDMAVALNSLQTVFKVYTMNNVEMTAFVEVLQPPVSLHVFGAGNDVIPLVGIAGILGWELTVIDGRRTHANVDRFPEVGKINVEKANTALNNLVIDEWTVAVLMTHNYNYDMEVLGQLVFTNCSYIGILGPKKKLNRMLDELATKGTVISPEQLDRIYSPIGLDLGAETSEEIALSISAEIKAFLSGRNAQMLRDKQKAIHH
jgi:xanthine dehydrogenase accessory factor